MTVKKKYRLASLSMLTVAGLVIVIFNNFNIVGLALLLLAVLGLFSFWFAVLAFISSFAKNPHDRFSDLFWLGL